jgi:hypothetical protein
MIAAYSVNDSFINITEMYIFGNDPKPNTMKMPGLVTLVMNGNEFVRERAKFHHQKLSTLTRQHQRRFHGVSQNVEIFAPSLLNGNGAKKTNEGALNPYVSRILKSFIET